MSPLLVFKWPLSLDGWKGYNTAFIILLLNLDGSVSLYVSLYHLPNHYDCIALHPSLDGGDAHLLEPFPHMTVPYCWALPYQGSNYALQFLYFSAFSMAPALAAVI